MDISEINVIVKKSKSKSDVCRGFGFPINGTGLRKVNEIITENNIDVSHFDRGKSKMRKYVIIDKECPVCGKWFTTKLGHRKEKTVCSHSCANTFFRTGDDNPNYKNDDKLNGLSSHRIICFRHHEKKCVCCDEKLIVEVHHYDGNNKNNKPENFVPLCPTHHKYWHSRFRWKIRLIVDNYVKKFKEDNNIE